MKIVPRLTSLILLAALNAANASSHNHKKQLSKGEALRVSLREGGAVDRPVPLTIPRGWAPSQRRAEFDKIVEHLPSILHNTEIHTMLAHKKINSMALILSIIKQESSMNQDAVSPVGAVGYMQLMPNTFIEVYNGANHRYFDPNLPKRIDHSIASEEKERIMRALWPNLTAGVLYFRFTLERFWDKEPTIDRALAAYNAGPGTVRSYLRGRRPLPHETVHYVKNIKGYYNQLMAANSYPVPQMAALPDERIVEFYNFDQCSLEGAKPCKLPTPAGKPMPKLKAPEINMEIFNFDQCSLPGVKSCR